MNLDKVAFAQAYTDAVAYAERYATPPNEVVKQRVIKMQNALNVDPYAYQMNECKHCKHLIARRFPLEGKPGEWRHLNNAHTYCPNQAPDAGKFFVAQPVHPLPSEES